MKDLLETVVKPLVDNPDDVNITETEREDAVVLELHVNSADMGKVIGKQGRIAKAIRTVMKSITAKENKTVGIIFEE